MGFVLLSLLLSKSFKGQCGVLKNLCYQAVVGTLPPYSLVKVEKLGEHISVGSSSGSIICFFDLRVARFLPFGS